MGALVNVHREAYGTHRLKGKPCFSFWGSLRGPIITRLIGFKGFLRYIHLQGSRCISVRTTGLNLRTKRQGGGWNGRGVKTILIEPGSPWEDGGIELFNGKLSDELPNREVSATLTEA